MDRTDPNASAAAARHETRPLMGREATDFLLTGDRSTSINLLKSFLGAGLLALPYAFRESGILLGFITLALASTLSSYGIKMLVFSKMYLSDRPEVRSYTGIVREVLGVRGYYVSLFAITLAQIGTTTSYVIFASKTLHNIASGVSQPVWVLILSPILYAMSTIKNIKNIAPISLFGLVMTGIAVLSVLIDGYASESGGSLHVARLENFPISFGIMMFSMEAISGIFPIHNEMVEKHRFPDILDRCFVILITVLSTLGISVYAFFGDSTKSVVTLNLRSGFVPDMVKILLAGSLIASFPIQLIAGAQVLDRHFVGSSAQDNSEKDHKTNMQMNVIRIALTTVAISIAIGFPHFGSFLSLIGGVAFVILGLIVPAMVHYKTFSRNLSKPQRWNHTMMIGFGLIAMVVVTSSNVSRLARGENPDD